MTASQCLWEQRALANIKPAQQHDEPRHEAALYDGGRRRDGHPEQRSAAQEVWIIQQYSSETSPQAPTPLAAADSTHIIAQAYRAVKKKEVFSSGASAALHTAPTPCAYADNRGCIQNGLEPDY